MVGGWRSWLRCAAAAALLAAAANTAANTAADAAANTAAAMAAEAPADPTAELPAAALPSMQEIEAAGAVIGEIRIVTGDVFDTADPREDKWLFRAANHLHIQTRPAVIERRLLFRPGDRFSVHLIEEAERVLRREQFLYDVQIRPLAFRDGVVDLEVATRDTWTLYPGVSVTRSGGTNKTEFSLNDLNLLGTGSAVVFGYFKNVDRRGTLFDFSNENLFGDFVALRASVANNNDGSRKALTVERPFYALGTRRAAGLQLRDDDRIDSVYNAGDLTAEYRHRERHVQAFGGWSGGLVDGWVRRWSLGVNFRHDSYQLEPGLAAPAALPADDKQLGPYVRVEVIEDRFERKQNRNQIGRPEFFAVGLNAALQFGWAAEALGSSADALLYEGRISRGFEPLPEHTLVASGAIKGRLQDGAVQRQQTGAAAQYFLPHHRRWLFYASLAGDVLTNPDASDFLYLGGDNGLRGYPLRYQSGTRRALLTLEERLYTGAFPWRLFRVGAAAFVDAGRAWGGSNVNAENPGWLVNVGLGLRFFSVRTAFGNVAHLDLAVPLKRAGGIEGVQLIFRGRASF